MDMSDILTLIAVTYEKDEIFAYPSTFSLGAIIL